MNKVVTEEFEIFPWNENLMTGISQIDDEHKIIVNLINKLANDLTQDKEFEVEDTFNELALYAEFHFKNEEKIWEKYLSGNELVLLHKKSHDSFLPEIIKLKEHHKDKTFTQMTEEILLFLIRWLAFHIVDEDKRLALILNSLNQGKHIDEAISDASDFRSNSTDNLIDTILAMYDNLSLKAISLIRERKARIIAENELLETNKKLEKLSITDQLTNLYNRRYFDEIFDRELKKSKRNKTIISLIIIDIDYFKRINDTYGHAFGDVVLKNIVTCLKKVCKRPNDFVFRVGGEEFTLLLTNEDTNCAISLISILQKSIRDLKIPNINSDISDYLSISGGLISLIPYQEDSIDSILKIADDRLYIAKQSGRNKIVIE